MKTFVIGENDADQRLDKFVSKAVKSLPQALLYKYIRLKRIKVNGKRAEISLRLHAGDTVELYLNDEFFEETPSDFLTVPDQVGVIYEDRNILLADKRPGLVVHEDESGSKDTLIARIQHYLYNRGEYDPGRENSFAPALCNRIDRNTGGIVIAAKNAESLRILNEKIRNREIDKRYLLIVHGRMKEREGTLSGFLKRDMDERRVYIHGKRQDGDLRVETRYRVLSESGDLSLLEAELLTGRTHQIRAQFAAAGHPLLGDGKYGSNALNRPYGFRWQALYAYRLSFRFSSGAGILEYLSGKTFEAPDVWFRRAFENGEIRKKN